MNIAVKTFAASPLILLENALLGKLQLGNFCSFRFETRTLSPGMAGNISPFILDSKNWELWQMAYKGNIDIEYSINLRVIGHQFTNVFHYTIFNNFYRENFTQ